MANKEETLRNVVSANVFNTFSYSLRNVDIALKTDISGLFSCIPTISVLSGLTLVYEVEQNAAHSLEKQYEVQAF